MFNNFILKTEEDREIEKPIFVPVKRKGIFSYDLKDSRCSSAPHKKDIKSENIFAYDVIFAFISRISIFSKRTKTKPMKSS